jgi:hypothetical protein
MKFPQDCDPLKLSGRNVDTLLGPRFWLTLSVHSRAYDVTFSANVRGIALLLRIRLFLSKLSLLRKVKKSYKFMANNG